MNYQTFSNLQFRPLLKQSYQSILIDLSDTSGEKIPFVSVGITRFVLMFRKKHSFLTYKRYKMVASRQVQIPFYRGIGRQRGRGFSVLAQVIGRTAIPFLRKYIVPAVKRVGADLLEFAAPENAKSVSGRKKFKTAAKSVGRQTPRKQLDSQSKKKTPSRVILTKSAKRISRSRRDISKTFLNIHVEQILVPTFVAVSGNLGRKIPVVDDVLSSHEQEIYHSTSLDENCIEFEFQTDGIYYIDLRQTYLALKLKLVKGRS